MDKKELRQQLGSNTHYNADPNQLKKGLLKGLTGTQPLQVKIRQNSISEDSTSPVGSPQSPTEFKFTQVERRNSKNAYMSFGFSN